MQSVLISLLLLAVLLTAGVMLHWLLAKCCKAVLSSMHPLATGEHEGCGYERRVYHTADNDMRKVVALALASGLLGWLGWISGFGFLWAVSLLVLVGAVAFDLAHWERVSASASYVWFQRGVSGTVHQLAMENIRDLAVDEEEEHGFTLRNLVPGQRNTVCRLRLRLQDKRIVALPRTDATRGLPEVEAVANHVRLRKQQAIDQTALQVSAADASRAVRKALATHSKIDQEMAAELQRLRKKALAPDLPASAQHNSQG